MAQGRSETLRLALADGSEAKIALADASTAIAVGDDHVWSYDLSGRPYALVRGDLTYRRALSGEMQVKGLERGQRVRRRIRPDEAETVSVLAEARADVEQALDVVLRTPPARASAEAATRLRSIAQMDARALESDSARFADLYGRVGIVPPDHYLSVIIQITEGCSWNECTFCDLYRDVPFRARLSRDVERHCAEVKEWLGQGLALRRTLFLGAANALCLGHDRLMALLAKVASAFPVAPSSLAGGARAQWLRDHPEGVLGMAAFVDAWTGQRKGAEEYQAYAELGVRQVYVGLETGDRELLGWLGKAGEPEDAVGLVEALHGVGIQAGVIVLVGAGGRRFDEAHVEGTVGILGRMGLGEGDRLFFSDLVARPDLPYGQNALREGVEALAPEELTQQRDRIVAGLRSRSATLPQIVRYDIEEFVY